MGNEEYQRVFIGSIIILRPKIKSKSVKEMTLPTSYSPNNSSKLRDKN